MSDRKYLSANFKLFPIEKSIALFVHYSGWYFAGTHLYSGIHTGKQDLHGSWKTPGSEIFTKQILVPGTWSIRSLLRAPFAYFLIRFSGLCETMSTPPGNTVLQGYFSKITRIIEFQPCSLAGFIWSLFCHVFNVIWRTKGSRMPAIARQ